MRLRRRAELQCSFLKVYNGSTKPFPFPPSLPSVSLMYMFHLLGVLTLSPSLRCRLWIFALRLLDLHVAHLFRALIAPSCRYLSSCQIPAQQEKGMNKIYKSIFTLSCKKGRKERRVFKQEVHRHILISE